MGREPGFEPRAVDLVGGRRFWVSADPLTPEQISESFARLEGESDQDGDGPLGICLVIEPDRIAAESPLAVWPETRMLHAGFDADRRAHRIRYFDDAAIGPAMAGALSTQQMRDLVITLEDSYRVVPFAEADEVSHDDVIAFWEREGAVVGQEARRRVHEVQLVGLERDSGIAAVSTAYLQSSDQLGMALWHYRGFVGRAHRQRSIASYFAVQGIGHMEERFTSGEDTRAGGAIFEIENDFLKTFLNKGQWLPSDFTFIGENQRGDHVRVHYFAGAHIPPQA
jgi:hypothetical protein